MKRFAPPAALRQRVVAIEIVEASETELTVLPATQAVLGFQFKGRVRAGAQLLDTAGVTGIQSVARRYAYLGETASVLVRFTPQGAACLGIPLAEVSNRSLPLAAVIGAVRTREVQARLAEALSDTERFACVVRFLLELPWAEDLLVGKALELLAPGAGAAPRVSSVADRLGLSERQLERRFLQRVGLSPKRFATLARFEMALNLAHTAPSLTRAALDAGYYDQSHFIREVARFAGVPPGELLRSFPQPQRAGRAPGESSSHSKRR